MPAKCCPACGQPLPPDAPTLPLTRQQSIILNVVRKAGSHGVSREALLSSLYNGDDGGPLNAVKTLHVQIYLLNKRLAPFYKAVRGQRGRGNDRYTYVNIGEE